MPIEGEHDEFNRRWCPVREEWVKPSDPSWPYLCRPPHPVAVNTTTHEPHVQTEPKDAPHE